MKTKPNTGPEQTSGRRTFLKTSAAAAAALVSGPFLGSTASGQSAVTRVAAAASTPSSGDKITIGMIGTGSRGMSNLRSVQATAGRTNVTVGAVCDLWDRRRDAARERAELPESRAFTDYRKMLELDDIDAVLISTTDQWHAKISIDAMNAGKHVYIEKPFTRYLGEAFDIYDTAQRTGKILQLGTQGASDPIWTEAAKIVSSGGIGPLVLAQASYMRNSGTRGEWNYTIDPAFNEDSLDWNTFLGPIADRPFSADEYFRWRKYYPYCAGIVGDLIPHRLSPMLVATGLKEYPTRVACLGTRKISTDRDVPDTVQILAEFPSGLTFKFIGSTVNEQGLPDMIRGHHASLTMGGNRINLNPERPFAEEVDPQIIQTERVSVMNAHLQNWYDSIRANREPVAGPEVSIRLQTILALAEMSERMNVMCLFDEKTRRITTGDGRELPALDYESEAAMLA